MKDDFSAEYHSFMVRCWREGNEWRVSTEDVRTGRRRVFADLNSFFLFLREKTAPPFSGASGRFTQPPNL
jgi:hypothetical protein